MVAQSSAPQILARTPLAPSVRINHNTKSRSTSFLHTLILAVVVAVAAVTKCAAQMEYLERSETESEASKEVFALRRVILETGPEVHTVMVFDTLPRIRSDELNLRIHY